MKIDQTFNKKERLTEKKLIDQLFTGPSGSFFSYPVKFSWFYTAYDADTPARILIALSKRNIPKAHNRNRIKRQMREVYRKNKSALHNYLTSKNTKAVFLLAYVAKGPVETSVLEEKLKGLMQRFINAKTENHT